MAHTFDPVHPGEVLLEDFIRPLGLSANRVAIEIHVPATRLTAIINGERGITADTALRLGRYLGTGPKVWMNLQARYELDMAKGATAKKIEREVQPLEMAAGASK